MNNEKQENFDPDPDLFAIEQVNLEKLKEYTSIEKYHIILTDNKGIFEVDLNKYPFEGPSLFFTSPYQHFKLQTENPGIAYIVSFHGDFYCIEYHKQEVACNGLLFNNIYSSPAIKAADPEINRIFKNIQHELNHRTAYSDPVLKSYLQLILAIASKIMRMEKQEQTLVGVNPVEKFRELLELHFNTERSVGFYAESMAMTPNVLTKKCKIYFGKSPSRMIQERIILESKKLLHLTYKSIKEIAGQLNFEDEHYFSRYFKKHTGIAPSYYREKTGISIVADLSMK
jgi:AraC family transcriptional activator of pobA